MNSLYSTDGNHHHHDGEGGGGAKAETEAEAADDHGEGEGGHEGGDHEIGIDLASIDLAKKETLHEKEPGDKKAPDPEDHDHHGNENSFEDHEKETQLRQLGLEINLKLTWCQNIYIYFFRSFGCLTLNQRAQFGNVRLKEIKEKIDRGFDQMEKDFNIKNFICQLRNS